MQKRILLNFPQIYGSHKRDLVLNNVLLVLTFSELDECVQKSPSLFNIIDSSSNIENLFFYYKYVRRNFP